MLIQRSFVTVSASAATTNNNNAGISIMQFNLLAKSLTVLPGDKDFNSKGFPLAPTDSLKWEFRCKLLLQEMTRFDPDLLCVEELDQDDYESNMQPHMSASGYDSKFAKKFGDSAKDGCAVFFKQSRFTLESFDVARYHPQEPQLALLLNLQFLHTNLDLTVIATHLKATKTSEGEATRKRQVDALLSHLQSRPEPLRNNPILIGTDMNATPPGISSYTSEAYPTLINSSLGFDSAYRSFYNAEPEFTTLKVRKDPATTENSLTKHTIDYIFFSKSAFQVVRVLEIPKEISGGCVPNLSYPSDHFAIMAEFALISPRL